MKILILGGTGLISTAITTQLLQAGHQVTLFNRGLTKARTAPGAEIVTGDRKQFAAFEAQMRALPAFDCVIDMICFTPEEAESAVRAFSGHAGHVIFCSTVDVYSKPASCYPILEDEPRVGNNDYGRNKILCEDIFFAAGARGAFPITIIRPAMTYGEGGRLLDWKGWNTAIIDRIRKGKPLLVHGDGSAFWVVCHVEDAARAFVNACGNPITFGKSYHVTGEEWLTWNRYYALIAEALQVPTPPLIHIPTDLIARLAPTQAAVLVANFQGSNVFDNRAARQDLDFRYTISWLEGAGRAIGWLDAQGQVDNSDDDPIDDQIIAAWQQVESTITLSPR
ncbi:MAG: NAD-dependent epimerase/dehydratase family protein [Chloroflexota bacterium]|nr:NAD-dependent epimerase/dehydratase family protein [Chloroflexota bacterium]